MRQLRPILLAAASALLFSCGKSKSPPAPSDSAPPASTNPSAAAPATSSPAQSPTQNSPTPVAPPIPVASPEVTWHSKTNAPQPLFAYLYVEDARAGSTHIRVLAASLIYPGPHQIDITYRRDPAGPEQNVLLCDFANRPDVDGIRWSLRIDDTPQAHGKYPQQTGRLNALIDGPAGTLQPETETAILAESPSAPTVSLQAALDNPDHLFLWLRLQSTPGWHGDVPDASDAKPATADTGIDTPQVAAHALQALEAAVRHQQNLTPIVAIADAGKLNLVQAAPLLELLWSDPALQNNDTLRKQIILAAAQIGQPLDILQQAAASAQSPIDRIQAAIGLMRQGDADARNIPLDYAKGYLNSGPRNFTAVAPILTQCIDPDIRIGIQSLSALPNAAGHAAEFQTILTAIDNNLLPVDQLISRASANAASDPAQNIPIFQALGEHAAPSDIPLIQQIPPVDPKSRTPANASSYRAKVEAIARITQRFWREADRIPGSPNDNSMP